jgi:hypothetical protein
MDYTQAEADIVARLAPLAALGHAVSHLPENQAEFERAFSNAGIIVGYSGSDYGHSGKGSVLSTADVSQEEIAEFTISIQSRTKRGPKGIHDILSKVKKLVLGFQPTDGGRLYFKEGSFPEEPWKEGLWTYNLCVACKTRAVQDEQDTDLDQALITQIKFIDDNNLNDEIIIP